MSKIVFRPSWSYDTVKTEEWLSQMHQNGYALQKINFKARLFYFIKTTPAINTYRIVFEKGANGNVPSEIINGGYESVCFSKNYFVIRTAELSPEIAPSYNGFLDKNKKMKFVVGLIILGCLCMIFIPAIIMAVLVIMVMHSFITGNFTVGEAPPENAINVEFVAFIFCFAIVLLAFAWLIYTYFKLRITNKQLEKLCGDTLDLSFSLPKENLMSKEQEKALRKEKRLIRKRRIAWVYAPDKLESWLEQKEREGYNLYRMSKLGNSFYFIKGEPQKIKYCFDYQNKAYPQYYNLNKESGWKLIFTSVSRFQSNNLWSQEYSDEPPFFYSDKESKLKQAKHFALTYSLCFFPVCVLYTLLIINDIVMFKDFSFVVITMRLLWLLLIFEFGFFATRTILYYFRIKKSFKK